MVLQYPRLVIHTALRRTRSGLTCFNLNLRHHKEPFNVPATIHPGALSMRRLTRIVRIGIALLVGFEGMSVALRAQDSACANLEASKSTTYGFHPKQLSQAQRAEKSAAMDRFWSLIKTQGAVGVGCLRGMLLTEKMDGFFVFDASSLLYSLDKSPSSLAAIQRGMSFANLDDIDILSYVRFLLQLSHDGVDIGPLADKYVAYPTVDAYVVQHAMKLDRESGAVILYGSMPPALVDKYLVVDLTSKVSYVRVAAALVLALNGTETSLKALKSFSEVSAIPAYAQQAFRNGIQFSKPTIVSKPKFSRTEILAMLKQIPSYGESFPGVAGNQPFTDSAVATLQEGDLDAVREARRRSVAAVSDEALDEYLALSKIIQDLINKFDLYREYRIHP